MPTCLRIAAAGASAAMWLGCAAPSAPPVPAAAPARAPATASAPSAADPGVDVVDAAPPPAIVTSADARDRIAATGLPWRVRHRATGVELVLIPPGRYLRGDPAPPTPAPTDGPERRDDTSPAHWVTLTRPFYLGRYEVTNAQYRLHDPSHASAPDPAHAGPAFDGLSLDGPDQPVVGVSWNDAAAFADRFGLRLPTEAEWEYACRAGTRTRYPWGDAPEQGGAWANLANPSVHDRLGEALREMRVYPFEDGHVVTAPVGQLRGNGLGVHDMIGNAWEWVADWYDADAYARSAAGAVDPRGPDTGVKKVMRGSSWQSPFSGSATCTFRGQTKPEATRTLYRGFRVAMDPTAHPPEAPAP